MDIVTLWHVLEHVPYPGRTLRKIKRLLKGDGLVFIAVPNDDGFWPSRRLKNYVRSLFKMEIDKKSRAKYEIGLDARQNEIHLSHFSVQVLENFLKSIGYEIKFKGLDAYHVSIGVDQVKDYFFYQLCSLFHRVFRVNLYETILMCAVNDEVSRGARSKNSS